MEGSEMVEAMLEINKQTGTWLQIENGELVNMDGIKNAKVLPFSYPDKFNVVLFPIQFGEVTRAFTGSEKACQKYIHTLSEFMDARKIVVYETHPCACKCGCKQEIIEGFTICDECDFGNHNEINRVDHDPKEKFSEWTLKS